MVATIPGASSAQQYQSAQSLQGSNGFQNTPIQQQEKQDNALKTQEKNNSGFDNQSFKAQGQADRESAPSVQVKSEGERGSTIDISV